MAHRFGKSFEPMFHPERLEEPKRLKKPSKVFVCSNADLFGDWVQFEWVEAVLEVVRRCPQHTFQFLTKSPDNLARYNPWPMNAWVGATATNQAQMGEVLVGLDAVEAQVKFVSAEPLLDWIHTDLGGIDWLIIGAMTGKGAERYKPPVAWVDILLDHAGYANVPVWVKKNLRWITHRKEWPR